MPLLDLFCYCVFMKSSLAPAAIKTIPNNFFKISTSTTMETQENSAAAAHPTSMVGTNGVTFNVPCLIRRIQATTADGIKNRRLMLRAVAGSICRIIVNHRISRLPPPIPSPDKNPNTVPMINVMGRDSNINIENLPK